MKDPLVNRTHLQSSSRMPPRPSSSSSRARRAALARLVVLFVCVSLAWLSAPLFASPASIAKSHHHHHHHRDGARRRFSESLDSSATPVVERRAYESPPSPSPSPPSPSPPPRTAVAAKKPEPNPRVEDDAPKLSGFVPREHFEASGDVVKWGENFILDTAEACHDACVEHKSKGCTTFVWCGDENGCSGQKKGSCWLKRQPRPRTMAGANDASNPWTSGSIYEQDSIDGDGDPSKKFHVVLTTNKAVYQGWQARVMYYHFKKQKEAQGPDGPMGGFTRVLHDDYDGLEKEIPTCKVDRLEDELGFVVLSRPFAFVQFFEKCPEIKEDYILMAEPDHVYIKPVPNLMRGDVPAAFPFFYMTPWEKPEIVERFLPGITREEMRKMDPIGSSPVFIHKRDLKRLAPEWASMSVALQKDPEAKAAWGWVIEMYGYTLAAWKLGIHHDLRPQMQSQPPWDKSVGDFISIHFTYGMDYDAQGAFTPGKRGEWRFDKRSYSSAYPPKVIPPPPEGMDNELVRVLVDAVNEAAAALPNWGEWGGSTLIADFH